VKSLLVLFVTINFNTDYWYLLKPAHHGDNTLHISLALSASAHNLQYCADGVRLCARSGIVILQRCLCSSSLCCCLCSTSVSRSHQHGCPTHVWGVWWSLSSPKWPI